MMPLGIMATASRNSLPVPLIDWREFDTPTSADATSGLYIIAVVKKPWISGWRYLLDCQSPRRYIAGTESNIPVYADNAQYRAFTYFFNTTFPVTVGQRYTLNEPWYIVTYYPANVRIFTSDPTASQDAIIADMAQAMGAV